jgi:hypothetical protein
MAQATISIDVAAKEEFVDARDWQAVLSNTLNILDHLTHAVEQIPRHAPVRWRISEASLKSPLHVTLSHVTEGTDGATEAVQRYIYGLSQLESEEPATTPPPFFDEATLRATRSLVAPLRRRVQAMTFSAPGLAPVTATIRVVANVEELIGEKFKASGALEGILETLSVRGKTQFKIHDPLTDVRITCYIEPGRLEEAKAALPHRVAVYGAIKYAKNGRPLSIVVDTIRRMKPRGELPQTKDLQDIDITGGTDSSEYIRGLRDE